MKAAVDPTTIELRRGASSPLKSANRPGRTLGDYSNHNESDISGDYCGSDLHSPLSMHSSGSSEKLMSPSDSVRNQSDISEGCPSPIDKDAEYLDTDMMPGASSPRVSPKPHSDANSLDNHHSDYGNNEQTPPKSDDRPPRQNRDDHQNSQEESDHKSNDNSDQKQMADIVGDASSPGEFFDHALEFINGGEKEEKSQWSSNELKKHRSPCMDAEMPESKRQKTSGRIRGDESALFDSHERDAERPSSLYCETKRDSKRLHRHRSDVMEKSSYYPLPFDTQDRTSDFYHTLTPDQKFFVEAFKREVTTAAEQAAEASALRILEILESQGIIFGRSTSKYRHSTENENFSSSKHSAGKLRPESRSILEGKIHAENTKKRERSSMESTMSLSKHQSSEGTGKDGSVRASGQPQIGFGNAHMNTDKETAGFTADSRRRSSSAFGKERSNRSFSSDSRRKMDVDKYEEQNQALSLVTKPSRSPRSTAVETESVTPSGKSSRDAGKSSSHIRQQSLVHPFVRNHLESSKNPFAPPITGLPLTVPFSNHLEHAANPLSKYLPEEKTEISERRARIDGGDDLAGKKMLDSSPFSLAAAKSPKSKGGIKSRISSLYNDEKRLSPTRNEEKRQMDLSLPTSLALHGASSGSAFRKHETRRSPTSTGMRSLRSNGSPENKSFPAQNPFNMMYNPFANLPFPLGVPQSPHLAAVSLLASFNQRQNQNDYRNMRSSHNTIPSERIPVHHPSLRGHPNGSFLAEHPGYDMDGSSYAFPNNMQEGLTPQHLKKAKLMFFYTRYPNANTLKTYFPDVKFTRAITSQLIKWFSNFREFFYIQMEKFARQAITDGMLDPSMLRVTRDSEIFRVLNLHYNKCNEFYVPSTFLNAAEASQREFFNAVKAGKDSDPAWKKVIYKIICKLDSEIPELFKSPNVLDRLHEIRD